MVSGEDCSKELPYIEIGARAYEQDAAIGFTSNKGRNNSRFEG